MRVTVVYGRASIPPLSPTRQEGPVASPELSSLLSHFLGGVVGGSEENDLRERVQVRVSRVSNLTSCRTAYRAQCISKANLRERMQLPSGYVPTRVPRRCRVGASPVRVDRSRSGVWVK